MTKENGVTIHDKAAYDDFLSEYKQVVDVAQLVKNFVKAV